MLRNIDCGYSLVPPCRSRSNEYPQSMFWAEIWKKSEFLSENFQILVVKFSIYLNYRLVFVMLGGFICCVYVIIVCFSSPLHLVFREDCVSWFWDFLGIFSYILIPSICFFLRFGQHELSHNTTENNSTRGDISLSRTNIEMIYRHIGEKEILRPSELPAELYRLALFILIEYNSEASF